MLYVSVNRPSLTAFEDAESKEEDKGEKDVDEVPGKVQVPAI